MPRQRPEASELRSSATLATSVFEKLRSDILQGIIPPGEKLRIDALRDRYQIGASPLREALNRLSSLHLVEQIDQRGFRVTVVDPQESFELAKTRCWINEIAIREAIACGDVSWEEEIVLSHHRMRRYQETNPSATPSREWEILHRRFHAALVSACPSHWIRDFHETLFDLADRLRHLSTRPNNVQRDIATEHQAIMNAVVSRNVSDAIELLNTHMMRTAELASKSIVDG